ncbi:MAG: hypothetical protein ACLGJB_11620 [Blastocatellia bacterium]
MRKREPAQDERLDHLGKSVVRAGGISDEEAEAIASSPFSYARLRAGIEAERRPGSEPRPGRLITLLAARRAIPALLLIAALAVGAFWLTESNSSVVAPPPGARNDDLNRVVIGGTCALSSTEECAISTEEVLATLFAEGDAQR